MPALEKLGFLGLGKFEKMQEAEKKPKCQTKGEIRKTGDMDMTE